MAIDALAKRFFPGIVLALIALAAYLQASGVMHLVATAYLAGEAAPGGVSVAPTSVSLPAIERRPPKSAGPILSRNPFDSVTGPLNRPPAREEKETVEGKPTLDLSDPFIAPDCGGIAAQAITESTDPEWSVVVLKSGGDAVGKMRRVGDAVGDKHIAFIGYNSRRNSPAAWLIGGATLCQVLLFGSQTPPAPPTQEREPPPPKPGTGVLDDIARRIRKVSDTEFQIDRAVVDTILERQTDLMRAVRIVPEQKDGKFVGIRLVGIRPQTLLGKLGLQDGDRLETINGFEMASPERALEAYARLRSAESLSVKVTRHGKPVTIELKIQ